MRIVALSDTHGYHADVAVPGGDLLIHAGDLTRTGDLDELADAARFLEALPHRHKIVIAGNHDFCLQNDPAAARRLLSSMTYLEDEGVTVDGVRIWGSPWQPWFYDWAFNLQRGPPIRAKWELIPEDVDVLVTHGPPHGILDATGSGEHVGCEDLRRRIEIVRPKVHVFGHIHESRGVRTIGGVRFANVATNEGLEPATIIEI
jgi:Icc-related predicted phosphoesterase